MVAETMESSHDKSLVSNILQPTKDDILQYYYNYETINHYECQTTTTLDTISVPYKDCYPPASPQMSSCAPYKDDNFYPQYPKKPNEVSEISNLDHNHGLSFGDCGTEASDAHRFPDGTFKLALPLNREIIAYPMVSSEFSNVNFDSFTQDLKSIKREAEDSLSRRSVDDIIGITYVREFPSYTPNHFDVPFCCTRDILEDQGRYLDTFHNNQHPKSNEEHGYKVGGATVNGSRNVEKYVPVLKQTHSLINEHVPKNADNSSYTELLDFQLYSEEFDDNEERDSQDIEANVCDVTEAKTRDSELLSNLYPLNVFKDDGITHFPSGAEQSKHPQLYSDEAGCYGDDTLSQSGTSSMYELHEPLTRPQIRENVHTLTGATDKSETFLTHSLTRGPCIPHPEAPSDKFSINVSVNGKGTEDMAKVSCNYSPSDSKAKPHLLSSEYDRYWTGPDYNNKYVCLFKDCGKTATRRYNIRTHIQTHLGDRPFNCKFCLKSFVRWHDLNRHISLHTKLRRCSKVPIHGSGAIFVTFDQNHRAKSEIVFND